MRIPVRVHSIPVSSSLASERFGRSVSVTVWLSDESAVTVKERHQSGVFDAASLLL